MNSVEGVSRLWKDLQRKSKNEILWGEGMRVRRKMKGVRKRSGLQKDSGKKRKRGVGDVVERRCEGPKIRRVVKDEKKQNKTLSTV